MDVKISPLKIASIFVFNCSLCIYCQLFFATILIYHIVSPECQPMSTLHMQLLVKWATHMNDLVWITALNKIFGIIGCLDRPDLKCTLSRIVMLTPMSKSKMFSRCCRSITDYKPAYPRCVLSEKNPFSDRFLADRFH